MAKPSLWSNPGIVLMFALFAWSQAERLGPVHVDPQTADKSVRITMAGRPSAAVHSSPEAVKTLSELIAANGVDPKPSVPWHVELSYDEFDEDGDNVHSGTVEEFYMSLAKYRRIIKTDEFSQTEVATGSSLYRVRDQGWPKMSVSQAIDETLSPLYRITDNYFDGSPDALDWTVGQAKLSCVALRNGRILSDNGLPKFCYEPGTAILRYTRGQGWDETVYNEIFPFEQRYVANEVDVTHGGKPFLKIHVSKIETLQQLDSALFSPPADSPGPIAEPVRVPGRLLIELPEPGRYPPSFPRGVRGKVTVAFTVDKKGHVKKATATDGPEELRKPTEKAAKDLRFRPFLLLGKPVEVESAMSYDIHDRMVIHTTLP